MRCGDRTRGGRVWAVAMLAALALVVSGCTSDNPGTPGGGPNGGTSTGEAKPVASISITPGETEQANPTTPIVVKASGGALGTVTVANPAKNTRVKGTLNADKSIWTSSEPLAYGTAYQVSADATGSDGKQVQQKGTVNTVKPKATAFPNVVPGPTTVQSIGVGQPLVIQFSKDIPDRKALEQSLTVTTTPSQPGGWYWLSNKELHYRGPQYWQPNSTIKLSIKVYGKDLGGGTFGESDRDITYKVHDSWVAKANGANQQMDVFQNGNLVKSMPISMGKDATPTSLGAHVVSFKADKYTMDSCTYGVCGGPQAYRSVMNWSVRISNSGEFVHENPNSVNSQGRRAVSHGCINVNPENGRWFFEHFNIGDVVEVINSGGPPLKVFDTYGDWAVSWAEWQAGSALK